MQNIIASPGRYIQGKGAINDLCKHAGKLGTKLFILISASGKKRVGNAIDQSAARENCEVVYEIFSGECSRNEIDRVGAKFTASGCEAIIGIGGGKIQDTSKAVAYYSNHPVVIVPTIASTDAPCSALSVIYTDAGVFEEYLFLPASPNLVLVDTDVITAAPVRLLVAGIGDALATWFEARACIRSQSDNFVGGKATLAAEGLAKLCYETLLADAVSAKIAAENHVCTKAVENIIEANTLLSGIGFESVGLAASHAIHNGMTALEETHEMYHGEKVAYGTLVQLVLENAEEFDEVFTLCQEVGLPTTLAELSVTEINHEKLMEVARLACAETDTMGSMPFAVTAQDVYNAIIAVNAYGRKFAY